jgi:hypothetical protein
LEISGELLTNKLEKYQGGPYLWSPPPFFQVLSAMGHEKYAEFKERMLQFLFMSKNDWPAVRRINELWISGKYSYLPDEVHKYLPRDKFPMNNQAEMIRGVHQLTLLLFWPILDSKRFQSTTELIFTSLPELAGASVNGLRDLLVHFNESGAIEDLERKLLGPLQAFVDTYRFLIPVFTLGFYEKPPDKEIKGLTTAGFEDLKHYYADTYEVLGECASLVIAYNNLKVRKDYRLMKVKRRDVTRIEDVVAKSKGERIQFLEGDEPFDEILYPDLDNKLRNAIAHNSYSYAPISQKITYFPSGVTGKGDEKQLFLLDFAMLCWSMHQRVISAMELVYQTRKLFFAVVKRQKTVGPEVFSSDAGKKNYKTKKARKQKKITKKTKR